MCSPNHFSPRNLRRLHFLASLHLDRSIQIVLDNGIWKKVTRATSKPGSMNLSCYLPSPLSLSLPLTPSLTRYRGAEVSFEDFKGLRS